MIYILLLNHFPLHPDVNFVIKKIYVDVYGEKIHDILKTTKNIAKQLKSGHNIVIHDSRFARTGYHDEQEWKIYKYILSKEKVNVQRYNYTGLDSSIIIQKL